MTNQVQLIKDFQQIILTNALSLDETFIKIQNLFVISAIDALFDTKTPFEKLELFVKYTEYTQRKRND